MNVIEYCAKEVWRQGHDLTQRDGIERTGWMLNAWSNALEMRGKPLTLEMVLDWGMMIEPVKNRRGFRRGNVRVTGSNETFPEAADVRAHLVRWLENLPSLTPLDAYRDFELIHPFIDGNGRTGKVILNALNGTLLDPIFPPADFWGRVIRNP